LKILGIDPGLSVTGIALLETEKKPFPLAWETIKYPKGKKRLYWYFKSLSEILDREKPDLIVMEKSFRGSNTKTLIKLEELRGVYLLLSQIKGLPVVEFSPREIKQSVTGSGSSSKKQVRFMVQEILNIQNEIPLDASDAFAGVICYMNRRCEYAGIN